VIGLNRVKTWILIAALGGLFVLVGGWLGGTQGAAIALAIALVFNFSMYWFSDKIAIATTRSQPVTEQEFPAYHGIVRELTREAEVPMPRLYVSEMLQPNAFATGRNPEHAAVSVTRGILEILDERELRAVLAHELSHVANRDILISSIAAAIGMSITFLTRFVLFFGGDDNDSPLGLVGALAMVLLAPIAATIIQLGISRQREYAADATGARISGSANALADALERLQAGAQAMPMKVNQAAEPLYIVKPFSGGGMAALFSTHPPIEERVRRLRELGI
jgi:heat shock protein HtpX